MRSKVWGPILILILGSCVFTSVLVGVGLYWRRSHARVNKPPKVGANGEPRLIVQLGHSGTINAAAYSADGRFIVSGGKDDQIAILWEASTGREIRRFTGHTSQINSVAFSPDGHSVLTGSGSEESETQAKDYSARLWDIA